MSTLQERREVARAEALGRPVKRCPSCGSVGVSHWLPERLDGDRVVAGSYVCAALDGGAS